MVDDNDVVDDDDAGDDDDAAEDDVTLGGIDNGVVDGDDDVGEQVVERSDRAVRPIGQSGECPQYTPSNRGHRQYSSFCISPLGFVFSLSWICFCFKSWIFCILILGLFCIIESTESRIWATLWAK